MATPVLSGRAEVGKFYMVPCVWVARGHRSSWHPADGWVPTIGPRHNDAEFLQFDYDHYHVDWRFVPAKGYGMACSGFMGVPHGRVLTSATEIYKVPATTTPKRRMCRREMPDFPSLVKPPGRKDSDTPSAQQVPWQRMERAQAFVCNKLKPGNICPHRGIDLTPFIKEDGTVICPGHGLRWDTKTGDLLPHHARSA